MIRLIDWTLYCPIHRYHFLVALIISSKPRWDSCPRVVKYNLKSDLIICLLRARSPWFGPIGHFQVNIWFMVYSSFDDSSNLTNSFINCWLSERSLIYRTRTDLPHFCVSMSLLSLYFWFWDIFFFFISQILANVNNPFICCSTPISGDNPLHFRSRHESIRSGFDVF